MKTKLTILLIIITIIAGGLSYWVTTRPMISTIVPATTYSTTTIQITTPETCDSLYEKSTNGDLPLPITCAQDIGKGESSIIVTVSVPNKDSLGALNISRNNQEIFSLGGDVSENGVELVSGYGDQPRTLRPGSLHFEDVTFDGYKDLIVLVSAGAYNFTDDIYAYNPTTKTFDPESILSVTNESFHPEIRQVVSHFKGRGIGDIYTEETYEFRDKKYVLIKSVSQDIISFDNPERGYVRTTEELVNGKMVETKNEHFSLDEIMNPK